jgi:KUP system potassium uptake protein
LHDSNIILTVITEDTPQVADGDRIVLKRLSDAFIAVTMRFGYMGSANVPIGLAACRGYGLKFDVMSTSFFCPGEVCGLRHNPKCRAGKTDFLFFLPGRRMMRAGIFTFRQAAVEIGTQITI